MNYYINVYIVVMNQIMIFLDVDDIDSDTDSMNIEEIM